MSTALPKPCTLTVSNRRNLAYLLVSAIIHSALGAAYADVRQFVYFSTFVGLVLTLRHIEVRFSESVRKHLVASTALGGLLVCVALLPTGPATAVMLMPYAVMAQICYHDWRPILTMVVLGILSVSLVPYLGLATELCGAVPELLTYSTVFAATLGFAFLAVNRARARAEQKELEFIAFSIQLGEESDGLAELQDELQKTNAEVAEANASLRAQLARETSITEQFSERRVDEEELVRAIHHDLREPLRSIVSFNQLISRRLSKEPDAAEAGRYLTFAGEGGLRMVRMLDDLLAYTSGGGERMEPVDLGQVMNEISFDLNDLLDRSGARLGFGELPVVLGYRTQLVQLCQNLLSNAIKFARPDVPPVVNIGRLATTPAEFNGYCLTFSDNGIGIPADKLEHVFGLFNRAHQQNNYEGGGVGLALCRRIAIAHGASLEVTSVEGQGTQFLLSLPPQAVVGRSQCKSVLLAHASAKQDSGC